LGNLILLSGGLDSAFCLHKYGAELAVGFDYGQPHLIELDYAEKIAAKYGVLFERHKLMTMPRVNDVVFAGRNAVFIAAAASIAQTKGLKNIVIGCNFTDHERFPDCRPPFIRTLSECYREAYGVSVYAPLLTTSKTEIVRLAREAGLPQTWTCYAPRDAKPCGECGACKVLEKASAQEPSTTAGFEAWTK
jgi:7-cyano-7-deazaguanine synthase